MGQQNQIDLASKRYSSLPFQPPPCVTCGKEVSPHRLMDTVDGWRCYDCIGAYMHSGLWWRVPMTLFLNFVWSIAEFTVRGYCHFLLAVGLGNHTRSEYLRYLEYWLVDCRLYYCGVICDGRFIWCIPTDKDKK